MEIEEKFENENRKDGERKYQLMNPLSRVLRLHDVLRFLLLHQNDANSKGVQIEALQRTKAWKRSLRDSHRKERTSKGKLNPQRKIV